MSVQPKSSAPSARAADSDLDSTAELPVLDDDQQQLRSWRTREKQFEEQLALRDRALALVQQDLTTAQAVAATYLESLRSLEGRRGIFEHLSTSLYWEIDARETKLAGAEEQLSAAASHTKDLEAALAERAARIADLEGASLTAQSRCEELDTANSVQRKRAEELEAELATLRVELQQRAAALQEASTERAEHIARIAAGVARIEDLEGHIVKQQESVRVLQADCNAGVARVKELEGDLRAAEDMIHRLEAELRGRDSLERSSQRWRATVEETRSALVDRAETGGTHEHVPDRDTRLLIREEGDGEVVHVLGRKTSVGRTPDNDLRINAKYISRRHAVILAGPAHTIIEDLNSTNGVLVNGRRIRRQMLRDGDSVMIGKAVFRFAVRSAVERWRV